MPWKADIGCLADGEMMDKWEVTGVRGELPREVEPRGGTPREIGLGLGLLATDEELAVRRDEDVVDGMEPCLLL
jgi:hypothetical protein